MFKEFETKNKIPFFSIRHYIETRLSVPLSAELAGDRIKISLKDGNGDMFHTYIGREYIDSAGVRKAVIGLNKFQNGEEFIEVELAPKLDFALM